MIYPIVHFEVTLFIIISIFETIVVDILVSQVMTMLLIQYLLCVHIHTKNVIMQFIIIVCFFIYFNVKFIFWKEGSFIQTKVGDKQQKPTPAFF